MDEEQGCFLFLIMAGGVCLLLGIVIAIPLIIGLWRWAL